MITFIKPVAEGLLIAAFLPSLIYMVLSMFVLHYYELKTNKKPQWTVWWSFDNEIRELFPGLASVARKLEVAIILMCLPWFLLSIFDG